MTFVKNRNRQKVETSLRTNELDRAKSLADFWPAVAGSGNMRLRVDWSMTTLLPYESYNLNPH